MKQVNPKSKIQNPKFEFISRSVEETQRLGERLGERLSAGDVVGLVGALGSGKTTFIQGMAKGLGIDPGLVRSPTFILLREYAGRASLMHIDGYRLENATSVVWLDLEWMFSPKRITVVEWADRFERCLPDDYLEIQIAHRTTNQRTIRATGHGPRSVQVVEELSKGVHSQQSTVHSEEK